MISSRVMLPLMIKRSDEDHRDHDDDGGPLVGLKAPTTPRNWLRRDPRSSPLLAAQDRLA